MSSLVIHMLIPTLMAMSVGIFRPRDAWTWSWAAWAVDIDYIGWILHQRYGFPNLHRALFHNGFLLLLAIYLGYRAWKAYRDTHPGATIASLAHAAPGWLLVPFYYASHLLLDLFQGGIAFFWPLTPHTYDWYFSLDVETHTESGIPAPQVTSDPGVVSSVPDVSVVYTWLTGEEFALVMLYLLSLGLFFAYTRMEVYQKALFELDRLRKRRRAPTASRR